MKIELLDHIRLQQERYAVIPLPYAKMHFQHSELNTIPDSFEYHATIEIFFRQVGRKKDLTMLAKNARFALAEHMYGSVESEIRAALRDLWSEGYHHSKAAARLTAMLPALRGESRDD